MTNTKLNGYDAKRRLEERVALVLLAIGLFGFGIIVGVELSGCGAINIPI